MSYFLANCITQHYILLYIYSIRIHYYICTCRRCALSATVHCMEYELAHYDSHFTITSLLSHMKSMIINCMRVALINGQCNDTDDADATIEYMI